jgi:hypothetical protein
MYRLQDEIRGGINAGPLLLSKVTPQHEDDVAAIDSCLKKVDFGKVIL